MRLGESTENAVFPTPLYLRANFFVLEAERMGKKLYGPLVVRETEEGCYLSDGLGFVMEKEQVLGICKELRKFALKNAKWLEQKNIEQEKYYDDLFNGRIKTKEPKEYKNKGYVYIMESNKKYKIGFSKDVEQRLKQLNNRPFPVRILATSGYLERPMKLEKQIHEFLEEYKIDGEWFDLPISVVEDVIRIIKNEEG